MKLTRIEIEEAVKFRQNFSCRGKRDTVPLPHAARFRERFLIRHLVTVLHWCYTVTQTKT